MTYEEKLAKLEAVLKEYREIAVTFSGGVDSTFLLLFGKKVLGSENVAAVTADAPNFAPDEIEYTKELCGHQGIRHHIVDLGASALEAFADNPPDRCYICKSYVFGKLLAQARHAFPHAEICDGTNFDDMQDYRPGRKALEELGISSPLKEAGLTKSEIRRGLKELSDEMELPELKDGVKIWSKPAFACLASRIPYGERITVEKLEAIHKAEMALRDLGFNQIRVRHHGKLARIEVQPEDRERFFDVSFMDKVNDLLKEAGFMYVTLDLGGYKMGSLNAEVLSDK